MAPVVVLAGGTGGARLARGMLDEVGDDLVVIANTGDDVEMYRGHVSPDPDLILYWLTDRIDARGWGLDGDTFEVMEGLRAIGVDAWFSLGDRDLAVCLERARRLEAGERMTDVLADLGRALGARARVVPMSDDPVRTRVRFDGRWWPFQEYMIRARAAGPVEGVEFSGAQAARPAPEALDALASARAIVIGPSNPVISIGPILAVAGMREALQESSAPVVAVSPLVEGAAVKGPTEAFMDWAGLERSAEGVARAYEGLIDGLVADERVNGVPVLETDVMMDGPQGRRRLARETLDFARALAAAGGRTAADR